MPQLVVQNGPLKGNAYSLDPARWGGEELLVGRSKDCHVLLPDSKVSKHHARLVLKSNRWYVEDLGSRNGVLLNGDKVTSEMLSPHDALQVGNVLLLFEEGDPEEGDRPAPRRPTPEEVARTLEAPTAAGEPAPSPLKLRVKRTVPSALPALGGASREELKEIVDAVRQARDRIRKEVGRVVIGQEAVIDDLLVGLLGRGHCLLEGVPGLAKTLLVRTLASVLDLEFKRIQFTPDLMPADITGTEVLEEDKATKERRYRFIKGPIFTNILLADEINRTPPKTQAALLEAMQEFRVTAAGTTYTLSPPFYVLATQNPIEQEGTYPLPEAQLDRFMFKIRISYPSREEEVEILRTTTQESEEEPDVVLGASDVLRLQKLVRKIPVSDYILFYAADLARATRPSEPEAPDFVKRYLAWGAGPRASQYLTLGAKARALMDGRVNVSAADVRSVALQVLRHRISLNFHAASEGLTPDAVVERVLERLGEPREVPGGRP
jgi:MoxR-like ATPase